MNQFIVRNIRQGDWYWVSRIVIQEYASQIGVLALSVYHFLASMADEQQSCFPSQSYIAKYLGCSRGSVSRSIKTLRDHNLIAVENKNRYFKMYYLLNISGSKNEHQMFYPATAPVQITDTNNIRLINGKNVNDSIPVSSGSSPSDFLETLTPQTKEELLAKDIAESLNDYAHLTLYLSYAEKYSESFLRQLLSEVKQKPIHKIKKSRGALFTYLINKYEKRGLQGFINKPGQ